MVFGYLGFRLQKYIKKSTFLTLASEFFNLNFSSSKLLHLLLIWHMNTYHGNYYLSKESSLT